MISILLSLFSSITSRKLCASIVIVRMYVHCKPDRRSVHYSESTENDHYVRGYQKHDIDGKFA